MHLHTVVSIVFVAISSVSPALGFDDPTPTDVARPPNIVILFMDDGGYGDLGSYGHPTIRTPHLGRMAREGMRFTQFYSASPACTASRYALLTGRLPVRSGFSWVLGPKSPRGLHPRELTLAEALSEHGYATACFGKWHLGNRPDFMPRRQGFDTYYGLPYSNDMIPPKWPDIPLFEDDKIVATNPDQSLLTGEYTRRAVDFIARHRKRPFLVYLPYAMPHVPLYPGKAFAGRSPRGPYGDVIEEIDASVGDIMTAIRRLDLERDTLVVFTSDNGPWIIKGERGGSSGLLRDGKGSTWEGGVRVPAIAWWPGTIPAGRVSQAVASTMDLYATGLALAGRPLPKDRLVDGRDITNVLRGKKIAKPRDPLFFYGPRHLHAIRRGPWKLHVRTSSQTGKKHFGGRTPLLFHLERDPSENHDVSKDHPKIVESLRREIDRHRAEVKRHPSYWN